MLELPWLYLIMSLSVGVVLGAWLGRLSTENDYYDDSLEQLEHGIDAMNEIEFLSPEDIEERNKGKQLIPWHVVEYGVNRIIRDIIKARFEPEIVVGIGRGGGVVACLIAGNLGNKPVTIMDRKLSYKSGKRSSLFEETPACVLESSKILLVIGGPSSGRAVLESAQKISHDIQHSSEIKTVNLFEKHPIAYAADFTYKSFKIDIKPPWQLKDEYKAFKGFD